jgi:hypothetical protein
VSKGSITIKTASAPPFAVSNAGAISSARRIRAGRHAFYHVKLEDDRTGYISAFHLVRFATDVDPAQAAADCKRRGDPRVGTTAKQVRATCWGEPDRVDRRETARGVTERYVYGRNRHVLLHNGVVTSVQISGTLR